MPEEELVDPRPWDSLLELAQAGDAPKLEAFVESLPPGEAARAISRLDTQEQNQVLTAMGPQRAAGLLEECAEAQAAELIEHLPPQSAAAILRELPSDHKADLITAMHEENAKAILDEMMPAEAEAARQLASYPPDSAGGLMVTELLSYPETFTAGQVLDDLRRNADKYADYDVQYVYILSRFSELVGVLRLRDLLLTQTGKSVADIMIRKPLAVHAGAKLDEIAEVFDRTNFFGLPVIDAGGRLLGVVRRRDAEQAMSGRAESDYLKSQGIIGGEELRTMPVRVRSTRRLSWLSLNIVLNIMAASVIAVFQDTLEAVIALAVFLPIISDMSGCAGSQAVAVSMRELSLGLVKPHEVMRVWGKEVIVGVINGVILGVLIALVALLWKGNPYLGVVAGGALAINTIVAVSVGGTLPLLLKRMGFDPALASGPILTTVTDMCGFFFVLSFATLMLPHLT